MSQVERMLTQAKTGALAVALFALAACGGASVSETGGEASSDAPAAVSSGENAAETTAVREAGTPIVPAASLGDIARWGSSVLAVSVVGEEARNTSSAGPGEVELGRDLTVRVEQVVWQHPQAVTRVSAGDQLSIYTFPGFVEVDGQRSPAAPEGAIRMNVGEEYVVAMADDVTDGAQVLILLNTFSWESGSMKFPNSAPVPEEQVAADLERLSTEEAGSGPRVGESLIQRVERVGQRE
ncbi:hypothetical protein [Serinicoccus marinus]|uniref:hypothetical protein n=2 Tax=Serinicoccus marinus TaxID=247333 RepID=UPI0012F8029E|nr:hypothetical protein [Serinicoccus marinus]